MMKAFFLVLYTLNPDNTLEPHHIGRLPSCAFAEVIVKQYKKQKKISDDEYSGYLCMSSDWYGDRKFPELKESK